MPVFLENIPALLYFCFFLISILLALAICLYGSKRQDIGLMVIVFIIAALFHGTRAPEATDLAVYYENFKNLTSYSNFAWGYSFYTVYYLLSVFTNNIEGFVFGSSLILLLFFLIAIILVIHGKCRSLIFLILILSPSFTDMAFNTIRQGMSLPFLILSIYYAFHKRLFIAIFYIVVSAGFHWNAPLIFGFALFALFFYKRNLKYFPVFLLVLIFVSIFYNLELAAQATKLLTSTGFVSGVLQEKIEAYMNAGVEGLNYYELDIPRRVFSLLEITFYIFVFKHLSKSYSRNEMLMGNDLIRYLWLCFMIASLYSISLISMTWYFRNFYWALGIAPFVMGLCLSNDIKLLRMSKSSLALLVVVIVLISIITTWRSGVMHMSYF